MIQRTQTDQPKFRRIFEHLCEAIEAGVYVSGRRLPSERALAEEFDVNVATVRRAFRDLIAAEVVEKKVGDGTYIRPRPVGEAEFAVNFILSIYESEMHRELVKLAMEESARIHLRCRICYAGTADLAMQLRTFIRFRQPAIVLGDTSLGADAVRELCRAPELFAVIANRFDHLGIPSVIGNDYVGIRILVNYLKKLGHGRIALIHSNSGHPIENIQIAVWKSCFPGASDLELRANVPSGERPTQYAFDCVVRNLKASRATALIALNDELAVGALSGATEIGLAVPENLSVVSIGDSMTGRYANPPLTELNPNLGEHIRQAFELLHHNRQQRVGLELLRIVEPELVERRSTAAVRVAAYPRQKEAVLWNE